MTDALIAPDAAPATQRVPGPQSWGEDGGLPGGRPEPSFVPKQASRWEASPQAGHPLGGGAGGAGIEPSGRLYMTSDVRAATGLPRTHMDFYLREGIVRPTARTESGYLLFDEAELTTLRTVLRWRREGIGIRQIRERLGR